MWNSGSTDLFSHREIALLIEIVKELPVLYAADKKSFKAVIPREKAWKIISEKLNRTVNECEKKWRYLRDKYVKERRRLLDEAKVSGKDVKSSWQHYESMEFLSAHLRLPSNNNSERPTSTYGDDEDSQRFLEDSPQSSSLLSPINDQHIHKPEATSNHRTHSWSALPDSSQYKSADNSGLSSDIFQPAALQPTVPSYSSLFNRHLAPPFAQHPLWTMWANGLQQAQHMQQQQKLQTQTTSPLTGDSATAVKAEQETNLSDEEPQRKKAKTTDSKEINIQLSLKDIHPAEKYAEYHFCLSLAQMMERIPINQRPELKIKLIRQVSEALSLIESSIPSQQHEVPQ